MIGSVRNSWAYLGTWKLTDEDACYGDPVKVLADNYGFSDDGLIDIGYSQEQVDEAREAE